MGFIQTLAHNILKDVIKPEVDRIAKSVLDRVTKLEASLLAAETNSSAAVSEVRSLRKQLTALQAIDANFKGTGKVVLLARVNGQDRVKIIDIKADMAIEDYKALITSLEREYGANVVFFDSPMPARRAVFGG